MTAAMSGYAQHPKNPQDLFNEALAAQQNGDNAHAVELYRELVKVSPAVSAGWINLGAALLNLGRNAEAVSAFDRALALEPGNARVQFALGLSEYKAGDFAAASRQLEPLAKAGDPKIITVLADCYLHTRKPREALELLAPMAAHQATDPDFSFVYGSALVANGRDQEGAQILEQYAASTKSPGAYVVAGDTLFRIHLYESALADYRAAEALSPHLPGLATKLGQALERNSLYPEAIEAFRKATVENPKDSSAWLGLAANLYSQRNLALARVAIERAMQLEPNSVDGRYTRALIEKSDGDLEAAVDDLKAVTVSRPGFVPAHAELAALYFRLHRPVEGARERRAVDELAAAERTKTY